MWNVGEGDLPKTLVSLCVAEVVNKYLAWAKDIHVTMPEEAANIKLTSMHIGWQKPSRPWIKINLDEAINNATAMAGAGGVARNDNDDWLFGYTRNIGRCWIEQTKLWGILNGLTIAWTWEFTHVCIESDNRNVVGWMNSSTNARGNDAIRKAIFELRNWNRTTTVKHIYKETNQVADRMAKRDVPFGSDGEAGCSFRIGFDCLHKTTC